MLRRIAGEEAHVEKSWMKMPRSYDTQERCAFCLRIFSAYWKDGKVLTMSVHVTSIGDGLWLCDEHKFSEEEIDRLKLKIKQRLTITGRF